MVWLAVVLLVAAPGGAAPDVVFADGVSAPVPLLRLRYPVLFYCHFPDKLLCTERASLAKRLYRLPLDLLEDLATCAASAVAVNSRFTAAVFRDAFRVSGRRHPAPLVLYPAVNLSAFVAPAGAGENAAAAGAPRVAVSLNRFERKKNIGLALHAAARLADLDDGERAEL